METTEKAKTYVASQSEAFANAIEKAYMQGYNDAVEENSNEHIKIVEDGVEYIDLGLPSGTLWALKNPKIISYHESQKINIPTKEQIEELARFVRWDYYEATRELDFHFIDIKGNKYYIKQPYFKNPDLSDKYLHMWYREELDEKGNATVIDLWSKNSLSTSSCFPGYKACAFLVK